jgi:ActR/RegA family two-component response regulator
MKNVQIFRHNKDWIVLIEDHTVTFHQTLARAMEHASAQIRTSAHSGTPSQGHESLDYC